jgi:guanyl-specific ribonuclease Sa
VIVVLINKVAEQAIQREANLPAGMTQKVKIDIRGQSVSKTQQGQVNAGVKWNNNENQLPTHDASGNQITYKEFDINAKTNTGRDMERFVVGSDGKVYYTNDHYKTFTEIYK